MQNNGRATAGFATRWLEDLWQDFRRFAWFVNGQPGPGGTELFASFLTARRASRVDPMNALREE